MDTLAELGTAAIALQGALAAKGYTDTCVKIELCIAKWSSAKPWNAWATDLAGDKAKIIGHVYGGDAEEALALLRAIIENAPHKWSPADVAATIGLPICALCDEAPATHDSHDDHYAPLGSRPERVCEPCLERAADRQVERAMEG